MRIVETNEALSAFVTELGQAPYLALDTEFLRDQTYYPKLCLIQVAAPGTEGIIDPLAPYVGLLERDHVPTMALVDDGIKYFWYHHTDADTMDKLDPHELSACAATMAVMAWQVADAPVALPRADEKNKSEP